VVGDHLHPLLKLGTLHLIDVLKVDDPVGIDIHLLPSDVEQLTGVVPPMLGLTKMMICPPSTHGPAPKVGVYRCGGRHSHAMKWQWHAPRMPSNA
jgi:hypothetical protein